MTVDPVKTTTADILAVHSNERSGGLEAEVALGYLKYTMMVDTGATGGISVTPSVADDLVKTGQATDAGSTTVRLANGATEHQRVIVIKDMTVGLHTLHNVQATAGARDSAPMLLSLDVLNAIGPFKVDAKAGTITFDTSVALASRPKATTETGVAPGGLY
jgi:predicted aspartyl protease